MVSVALYSSSSARAQALAELLALWPTVEVLPLKNLTDPPSVRPHALITDGAVLLPAALDGVPHLALTTPFYWSQFAVAIDQLLAGGDTLQPFACGPFVCVPLERTFLDDAGNEVAKLTEKEIALLRHLSDAGPQGLPRELILSDVWGYVDGVDTHTLETHIYRLRQKIDPTPAAPSLLLTTSTGYALAATLENGADSA